MMAMLRSHFLRMSGYGMYSDRLFFFARLCTAIMADKLLRCFGCPFPYEIAKSEQLAIAMSGEIQKLEK